MVSSTMSAFISVSPRRWIPSFASRFARNSALGDVGVSVMGGSFAQVGNASRSTEGSGGGRHAHHEPAPVPERGVGVESLVGGEPAHVAPPLVGLVTLEQRRPA